MSKIIQTGTRISDRLQVRTCVRMGVRVYVRHWTGSVDSGLGAGSIVHWKPPHGACVPWEGCRGSV